MDRGDFIKKVQIKMKNKILIANLAIQLGTNLICFGITMQSKINLGVAPSVEQHDNASNQLSIKTKRS